MERVKPVMFLTYEAFAKALASEDAPTRQRAELLLALRHHAVQWSTLDVERKGWFTVDDLVEGASESGGLYDYLSCPAAALYRVFGHIRTNLRTRILRENRLLPIHKANEFNSRSIAWLSRRPGRTIRQKLSGTKSVMAVERRLTVDTTENRLFKALTKRFLALLLLKEEALGTARLPAVESELIGMMSSFLHAEECEEIGMWTSPQPNNTLLSDRYYHVVWTVWMSLKTMDGQLAADQAAIGSRLQTASWMHLLAVLGKRFHLPQQPIAYHVEDRGDGKDGKEQLFSLCRSHFAARWQQYSLLFVERDARRTIGLAFEAPRPKQLLLSFEKDSTSIALQVSNGKGSRSMELTAAFAQQLDGLLEEFCPEVVVTDRPDRRDDAEHANQPSGGHQAVFDLYRSRPHITYDGVRSSLRQRLLLQQVPTLAPPDGQQGQEVQVCSLSGSRAAFLDRDWPIDSAADLIEKADDRPENILFLQQMFANVREKVRADELVLICPDHCNDFELKPARQMAKLQYFHVRTMPRSLDAVFRLMGQDDGKVIAAGDVLVFVDTVQEGGSISVTIVEARYDSSLAQKAPASRGLVFEHHPSCVMPVKLYELSDEEKEILRQLGTDFLLEMEDDFQIYDADDAPVDLEPIRAALRHRHDVTKPVREALLKSKMDKRIEKGENIPNIHIVFLAENLDISLDGLPDSISQKSEAIVLPGRYQNGKNEGEGVAIFDAWTKQAGMAIWRDFLPDIAIKRLIGQFDLVKNSTFEYGFLKEKDITVPGARFLLPKGQPEYHFQIEMSNVSEHTVYEAVVRHRAFPLAEDTNCLLRMKYTYDEDIPYSLDFIPVDRRHSSFTIAHVTWQRLKKFPTQGLRYMDFPPPAKWEALEHHISQKRQKEENLVVYLVKILKQALREPQEYRLLSLVKPPYCRNPFFYLEVCNPSGETMLLQVNRDKLRGREQKQLFDELNQNGIAGIDQIYLMRPLEKKPYWREEIDLSGYEWQGRNQDIIYYDYICDEEDSPVPVRVIKNNFIFQDRIPEHPGRISCSINLQKGFANDILDVEEPLFMLEELYIGLEQASRYNFIDVMRNRSTAICFDLHHIYGSGLTLGTDGCPARYQYIMPMFAEIFERYCALAEKAETKEENPLVRRMMNIFCMLHADAGHKFYGMLDDWVMMTLDDTGRVPFWVGFAFGDCKTPEQQHLIMHLARQDFPDFIGLLARAIWRYPDFIYYAPQEILLPYLSKAISIIVECAADPDRYTNGLKASAYEYVLAMFRLRRLKNAEIDTVLSLNNLEMRKLYRCLENQIRNHALGDIKTRICLTVTRSEEYACYADVPDFIYALLVCMTGTQDNSSIVITSIEDIEDKDD